MPQENLEKDAGGQYVQRHNPHFNNLFAPDAALIGNLFWLGYLCTSPLECAHTRPGNI